MIRPNRSLRLTALGIGFFFLYAPIISLMAYSFNESQLVTVWTRFSLKWYKALFHDQELLDAAWLSLRIAMMNAPLVIPEVMQGISLLLLFVALGNWIGWPAGRGMLTVWIGHVMLCISYVAIIVQSRLRDLNPALEEAALDLGAAPV